MQISRVPSERIAKTEEAAIVLREGQIVQGKINKLYPNNHAEVQIGGQRFIAEIKTGLEVGGRYIFQVGLKQDGTIQLQVIGEKIKGVHPDHIVSLLSHLELKISNASVAFVQSLVKERIPFNRSDLAKAIQLMDMFGQSSKVQTVLQQMIAQKFPMEENVFRALFAVQNQSLSSALNNTLQAINAAPPGNETNALRSLIANLIFPRATEQLANVPKEQVGQLVQSLSSLGLLPLENEEAVTNYTNRLFEQLNGKASSITLVQDLRAHIGKTDQHVEILQFLKQYKPILKVLAQMFEALPRERIRNLDVTDVKLIKQKITNHLLPLLPKSMQQAISSLIQANNETSVQQLASLFNTLTRPELYSLLLEAASGGNEAPPKSEWISARFLVHVTQTLETLGLNNEASLKQTFLQQENRLPPPLNIQQSIKALLLQMSHDERAPLENVQQMIHYISGLQLQTREENNLFQAYLQLPGAKLGLPEDLFMQFESRKTKDGKIDTDFCRILFFLHLEHLQETIIDMNIQKRVVTLTIYNELSDSLPKRSKPLQAALFKGLETLNYHLSSVKFKPLKDDAVKPKTKEAKTIVNLYHCEGIDFRI